MRLDKLIADCGYGTRSEVKGLLKSGAVTVNGEIVKDPGRKVDAEKDVVLCRGEAVTYSDFEYYMLYKPAGIITASRDTKEKTVVDLIKSKRRRDLSPVGRLDRDTEGLLLITNDGQLAHKLLAPGKHVDKVYLAVISGDLPEGIIEGFKTGIDIGDETLTKPAVLKVFATPEEAGDDRIIEKYKMLANSGELHYNTVCVTLTEGRYHEIKRMFGAYGCTVEYLKRISMGGMELDTELAPGDYKEISQEEINKVFL